MKLDRRALRFINLMPPRGVVARWRLRGNTRYDLFHLVPDPSLSGKAMCGVAGEWTDPVSPPTVAGHVSVCIRCCRFMLGNAHEIRGAR